VSEGGLRRRISQGRFQRSMGLFAGYFGLFSAIEAYLEHRRGSFNQRWMWTPILLTPLMVAAAAGATVSGRIARTALPLVSGVTLLDGLLGFYFHLRGIRRMPGHSRNLVFNVISGPPVFAPLLFTMVGLAGVVAALFRREEP
jgi:hypothetical protein